jgi:hypothetical protein
LVTQLCSQPLLGLKHAGRAAAHTDADIVGIVPAGKATHGQGLFGGQQGKLIGAGKAVCLPSRKPVGRIIALDLHRYL